MSIEEEDQKNHTREETTVNNESTTDTPPKMGEEAVMPAPTFSTFILSLASSALVHLGEVPEPTSGKHEENLHIAKQTIDILSMLEEKITNGLDEDEKRLLEGILYELRMKFIVKNS